MAWYLVKHKEDFTLTLPVTTFECSIQSCHLKCYVSFAKRVSLVTNYFSFRSLLKSELESGAHKALPGLRTKYSFII